MSSPSSTLPLSPGRLHHGRRWLGRHAAGLALCAALAVAAQALGHWAVFDHHGIGTLTLALLLGIVAGNGLPQRWLGPAEHGAALSRQRLLRAGVMLFGLGLTVQDLAHVGLTGVLLAAVMLASTFALAAWAGPRWLGLDRPTALLIGAGSAICGAAAVIATEPVVRARNGEATVAVSTVVLFGTFSVFLYPWLGEMAAHWAALPQGATGLGLYLGATVHEVAQVVAAGRSMGTDVASVAVIEKMVRVMLLAPFLLVLSSRWLARGEGGAATGRRGGHTPWFAWGFLAMVGLHSTGWLPAALEAGASQAGTVMLAMAMAALGLNTRWSGVRAAGLRPLALGTLLWAWLVVGGALLVRGAELLGA
ncbi:YeiH family putative sulfate export transporter [Ideonella dechloratans]|uniref:YeiH family putative sulfate export transporter n=1 Tax=Ideonella dechloratans TaxID=36863 RepID=A0A643F9I5_IDEDE|nr:YeiH family protein [Ideonella dechloratans]KAB0579912.1 YeiH family putative sulfate export transporter [Ideonella dechloratans]UFU09974.1 YeiH family protein [Ideonella dechloratans]